MQSAVEEGGVASVPIYELDITDGNVTFPPSGIIIALVGVVYSIVTDEYSLLIVYAEPLFTPPTERPLLGIIDTPFEDP